MDKAIEKLNKTVTLREKMIYAILDSKPRTDAQYYRMEEKLFTSSWQKIKRQYDKLTN